MIELDKSSDDLLKNESLIDLDADTAAFSMQSSRASTTFTQFFTQFGGSNDLRAYVADRSRIKELITLDSENSKQALKSYLNIYTTLHSGLEELRDLPAGPAREQRLTELMARTTTRACSDKGLDLEGTRALCNLLTHGEYQLEDFRRNQADFRQGSDLIRSIGAGIAAGSATLLPPSGVLLPLLAGFLADRGINSLAEDACLTLKRPRDSCSKHCLKSSAPSKPLQAQRINLRGELAVEASKNPLVLQFTGLSAVSEESALDSLSPLEREMVLNLQNAGVDRDITSYEPVRRLLTQAKERALEQRQAAQSQLEREETRQKLQTTLTDVSDAVGIGVFLLKNVFGDLKAAEDLSRVADAGIKTGELIMNLLSSTPMGPLAVCRREVLTSALNVAHYEYE